MSYTPNTWKSGDVVTSAKLNNIEQGIANIGSGVLLVTATETDTATVLDRTWQEIAEADFAVIILDSPMFGKLFEHVLLVSSFGGEYAVKALNGVGELTTDTFIASSADGYPTYTFE